MPSKSDHKRNTIGPYLNAAKYLSHTETWERAYAEYPMF
jgi:hypothetical protein